MSPKFNIDRPRISDDEIKKHQNFDALVEKFKQQSLKKARGDESWWQNKKIRYSTVIAGITVVCIITYSALFNNQKQTAKTNETLTTQNTAPRNNKEVKPAFINAPSKKLKTPYSTYKVSNEKGGIITHGTSSKIKIPKNSFADKNGKDVIGDVIIEYREFHDVGDIITSGIPMAYDSAGHSYHLETAGMFDIKGSQAGEPVFIKPDKKLEVELASASNEQRFNQYYLDTLEKNWKYLKKDHATAISKATASSKDKDPPASSKLEILKNEIEKNIPKKIDSVKVVYTAKAEKLPRPKEPAKPVKSSPGKPIFKIDGSYDDFPELAVFDNVVFEVGSENKNYSKELHDITWNDVKINQGPVKGKNYIMTLIYRNRSEKLIVYPVLIGADFEKAKSVYELKLETYKTLAEKRASDEKRILAEMQAKQAAYMADLKKKQEQYDKEKAQLLSKYNAVEQNDLASSFNSLTFQTKSVRLFQLSRFGIYNSDCPHPTAGGTSVVPAFALDGKEKILNPEFVYLIDHTNKTVYILDKTKGFKINYTPERTYSVCIFNRNKMYLCDKSLFKQAAENNSNVFAIKLLPEGADNLVDFKKAIEI